MSRYLPTISPPARARTVRTRRVGRRALALATAATAIVATGTAHAGYTAQVDQGTLRLTGDGASETLVLLPNGPDLLAVDVGADGTIDHEVDRSTFTAIDVDARGGDDEIRVIGNLADEQITLDGGSGDDTLPAATAPRR